MEVGLTRQAAGSWGTLVDNRDLLVLFEVVI